MRFTRQLAWTCLALVLSACGSASDDELLVHCTASVATAMRDILHRFEADGQESTVRLNVASSLVLERQLRLGAAGDVVVLAAREHLDRLEEEGILLPESRAALMRNRLALIVRSAAGLSSLEDLLQSDAQIALANAGVPAGDYARSFLENAMVWDRIHERCVSVRDEPAVLQSVSRGAVDAGVVYASSLTSEPEQIRELRTDPRWQPPIEYGLALVASTRRVEEAKRLRSFLLSPPAQTIVERHGFIPLLRQ